MCPRCLQNVEAALVAEGKNIKLKKICPKHGEFSATVWRGLSSFELWRDGAKALEEGDGLSCPENCGICSEHIQGSCCVLLEVTRRCNLHCSFCFADGEMEEPSLDALKEAVDSIMSRGKPLIQLSGGEPTLRDDLPELVAYIKSKGADFVQLNSNGLRLAEDEEYVKALAESGLSFVFLQFDGVSDDIYEALRGRALLETKKKAIELCRRYGLGVTLVPTLVKGINDHQVGDIICFGAACSPTVRGVHFQPVSYFGRYPKSDDSCRYTLDELICALGEQADIREENISPSRCDHPSCGLHASFVVTGNGDLMPLTLRRKAGKMTPAEQNRCYIGSRWTRDTEKEQLSFDNDLSDMDSFLSRVKSHGFTVTAMAFQDAMNFDVERLKRCSLHVFSDGKLKPFCAAYLTGIGED